MVEFQNSIQHPSIPGICGRRRFHRSAGVHRAGPTPLQPGRQARCGRMSSEDEQMLAYSVHTVVEAAQAAEPRNRGSLHKLLKADHTYEDSVVTRNVTIRNGMRTHIQFQSMHSPRVTCTRDISHSEGTCRCRPRDNFSHVPLAAGRVQYRSD